LTFFPANEMNEIPVAPDGNTQQPEDKTMSMVKEFKEFAMRGNVVDLAVGVIIGGAFGKIVGSVIEDLVMPLVGKVVGNVDFSNLYIPLSAKVSNAIDLAPGHVLALVDARKIGPVFAYGNFITVLINFIILAFCIFLLVKGINALKRKEAPAAAAPSTSEQLLMEIRDLLKKK
jgi:large conductance mechanosensitive channel